MTSKQIKQNHHSIHHNIHILMRVQKYSCYNSQRNETRNSYITACAHAVSTSKWENRLAQKIWIVAAGLNIKSLKQQEWEYVHTSRESSISHSVANMQSTWGHVCSRWSQIICPYYNRHHTTTKTLEISKRSWYSYDLAINSQGKRGKFSNGNSTELAIIYEMSICRP